MGEKKVRQRYAPNLQMCWICKEPLPEGKGRRYRLTCSSKCRQARHRRLKGQMSWRWKREKKEIERKRALPFDERQFNLEYIGPLRELSQRRAAHECVACGEVYVVNRITTGGKASPYCSNACEQYTRDHWKKFNRALERTRASETVDPHVLKRLAHHKLSPLCPCCGKPFSPNTRLDGTRLRGRPRKWCSDACRREAYEKRWKRTHAGTARGHRYRDCAECGTRIDRVDKQGRRIKRFCGKACGERWQKRAEAFRKKAKAMGQESIKRGASGHGTAARGSTKNRRNRDRGNTSKAITSGKAE